MTLTEFATMVTTVFGMVKDGIAILMEPPVVWFVALSFATALIGTAKAVVPRKKASAGKS